MDGGRFPIKRVVGETVDVTASVFTEGHDRIAAMLRYRFAGDGAEAAAWHETKMEALPNDRWQGSFEVSRLGFYEYRLEAWVDAFETWRSGLAKKVEAGQRVGSELLEGAEWVQAAAMRATAAEATADAAWLEARAEQLAGSEDERRRATAALDPALRDAVARHPDRSRVSRSTGLLGVDVERERARTGAWYELFPRSCSPDPSRHGTLRDVEARLPYVAEMGFDVLYLPPIHPIGYAYRKGPDNTPEAGPDDPGSPWAIGSEEGGHKSVHPALGTLADFDRLVARAGELGLEIALDLAFQCSPDHPYVKEHPEWFRRRPDGSIQYAENPPKKYQDIFPLEFECQHWQELWTELKSVVLFWADRGVRIFRVDNPHTKPFAFWEWLIRQVRDEHPDVVFLAEAFTRPSVMQYLAKAGFSQSYTYFTWRNTRYELETYLSELCHPPISEFMRGNLFANTPDILHEYLQTAGDRPSRCVPPWRRPWPTATACTARPSSSACRKRSPAPRSTRARRSTRYATGTWRIAWSLRDFLARLNEIRRQHVALTAGAGPVFHEVDNPSLIAYSRTAPGGEDAVLVVVNLDPHHPQTGWLELPLEELGIDPVRPFQVHDLLGGGRHLWCGERNFVSLHPDTSPAHVFRLRRRVRTEQDFDYYL